MALTHLQAGEVTDVRPLGDRFPTAKTGALFKTSHVEVIRLVLPQGKTIPEHKAPGELIVQCLEGRVEFTTMGESRELLPGGLLYLAESEPHALHALENSSVLVTIVFTKP